MPPSPFTNGSNADLPQSRKKPGPSPEFIRLAVMLAFSGGGFVWWLHQTTDAYPKHLDVRQAKMEAFADQTRLDLARASYSLKPEVAGRDPSNLTPDERNRDAAAFAAFLANPSVQNLPAALPPAIAQNAVDRTYAALFQQLKLTPEQTDALRNLLVRRMNVVQAASSTAMAQGINPTANQTGFARMVAQGEAAVDQDIHALLGDQGFQTYQAFNRRRPAPHGASASAS